MSNDRIIGIDILKIIACIGVIGLHSFTNNNYERIIYYCFTYAIPIFYMCSGYLLLNKNISKKYFLNKVLKIIRFYILWVIIYTLFFYFGHNILNDEKIQIFDLLNKLKINLPGAFIQRGNASVLWYIGALLLIYIYIYIYILIIQIQRKRKS